MAEIEQQSQTGKAEGIQVSRLEADTLYEVSTDEIKMRYKNAH